MRRGTVPLVPLAPACPTARNVSWRGLVDDARAGGVHGAHEMLYGSDGVALGGGVHRNSAAITAVDRVAGTRCLIRIRY